MKKITTAFLIFLLGSSTAFSSQITIKNDVNLRFSPDFLTSKNIEGVIKKGAQAEVIDEKTLASGNKAYKISIESIKPATSYMQTSFKKEMWVYGSPNFVESAESDTGTHTPCPDAERTGIEDAKAVIRQVENDTAVVKSDAQEKVQNLTSAGFRCSSNPDQIKRRGYVCIGKVSSYSEDVRVYIPENFEASTETQFNVFFHGLRRPDTFAVPYGDYGARLKESQSKHALLIIPESTDGVKSYEQFSRNPALLMKMNEEIAKSADIKPGKLTLSGHSGAYRVINSLLADQTIRSSVKKVGLFDAIYAPVPNLESWLKESQDNKFHLAWLSGNGASTEKQTNAFLKRMSGNSAQIEEHKIVGSSTAHHMNIMQTGGFSDFINSP